MQPVEKITYQGNSSARFKIIEIHETELRWIKFSQTPFPLGFNDNIYHEGNISKIADFDVFSLWEFRKRKPRAHGLRQQGNKKRKMRAVKKKYYFIEGFVARIKVKWSTFYALFLSSPPNCFIITYSRD